MGSEDKLVVCDVSPWNIRLPNPCRDTVMPTPKAYDDYPLNYTELFRVSQDKPIRIKFDTKIEAKRFRAQLYAFRTALIDEPHKAPKIALIAPLARLAIEGTNLIISYPEKPDAGHNIPESSRLNNVGDI